MVRTRTLSKDALSAQATTWKRVQADRCGRVGPSECLDPRRSVAGHDGSTGRARLRVHRRGPAQGLAVTALAGPHPPAGGVVDHAGRITGAPVGDLIDADPSAHRADRCWCRGHRGPLRPTIALRCATHAQQQHGEHAQCSVGGKPRAGVFESPGVLRARTRPRHMGHHHPMLDTRHPRGRGLQISLGGPDVQSAPPPRRVPTTAPAS